MTAATPHVKNGRVIAIAQTRTKRAKGHPNVPTMQEEGFDGFEATTWYGLVGPGKLPPAIAQKINARRQHRARDARRAGEARHLRRRGRRRLDREVRRTSSAPRSPSGPRWSRTPTSRSTADRSLARGAASRPRPLSRSLRASSITLPSFGRLPGARSAHVAAQLGDVADRSRRCASARPSGARPRPRPRASSGRRPSRRSTTSRAFITSGWRRAMSATWLRMHEHAAHLGRLVGAAHPALDALRWCGRSGSAPAAPPTDRRCRSGSADSRG